MVLWLREPALLRNPLLEKDLACLGDIILFWEIEAHVLALGYLSYMDLPRQSQQRPREQM